ncbi:hypothetical protein [Sulfurimonas sp.]|uniref:hypothetical protein n=1 Tax=Sulfurimonas sp. TaxID=2022749 RepID=UPI00356237C5
MKNSNDYFFKNKEDIKQHRNSLGESILYIVLFILFLYISFPILMLLINFTLLYLDKEQKYDKTFHTYYGERVYNDLRIDFYKSELEKSSKKFVYAQSPADIFKSDVQIRIARECIVYFIQEHKKNTSMIKEGYGIERNARNKFAITEELIEKTKENEKHIDVNANLYDYGLVNELIDDLTNMWHKENKKSYCDKNSSVEKMYSLFKVNYINKFTQEYKLRKDNTSFLSENLRQEINDKKEKWIKLINQN